MEETERLKDGTIVRRFDGDAAKEIVGWDWGSRVCWHSDLGEVVNK